MKLYLVRHGEAEASRDDLADRERALTSHGRDQVLALKVWLANRGVEPTLVHSSPAQRALETVDWLLSEGSVDPIRQVSDELYLASAKKLLELIRTTQSAHAALLIVGHNPGMSELALRLAGRGDPQALRRLAGGFLPAACAELVFPRSDWSAIEHREGALEGYWTPGAAAP
jgi:phosphohistidine phosphatase